MAEPRELKLPDEAATGALGAALAEALRSGPGGAVLGLEGQLGAGKTALARAFLRALGHCGRVPSPTYTLVEPYSVSGYAVYHIDLYRLSDAAELDYLGLDEVLTPEAVLLIEWPERGRGRLPATDLTIALQVAGRGRRATLAAGTPRGRALLERLDKHFRAQTHRDA